MYLLPPETIRPNTIHQLDALTLLRALPSGSVDLVVTSPPYNLNLRKAGGKWSPQLANGYDGHADAMPHDRYVNWQRVVLNECLRVIKNNGAIFYNHKWRIQNGLLDDRSDIVGGFPVRQIIIWQRKGGVNFNDGYFLPTYEVIYLIANSNFELVRGASSYGDVWEIPQEQNNSHPAPFPVALAERCIRSTNANLIIDPFMGSGSTAIAAQRLRRDWIGCDTSALYCEIARRRLAQPYTLPMFAEAG